MIRFNYQDSLQTNIFLKNKDFMSGLSIFLAAVIVFLSINFFAFPLLHSIKSAQTSIKENQLLLQDLTKKQTTLAQVQKIYTQAASSSAAINEAVSNYSDIPSTISIIEKINSEIIEAQGPLLIEGISMTNVPNDQPTGVAGLTAQESEMQISFVGDYQAIKDFITQLKALKHNFSVEQISLSAPKSTNLNQLLTVSIKLRYYYFNES